MRRRRIGIAIRIRTRKFGGWHTMGDHASESLAGEPRVQVEPWGSILKTSGQRGSNSRETACSPAGPSNVFACSYSSGSFGLAMSLEITTRSGRGDKRFSVSIERASAAAVSTRP